MATGTRTTYTDTTPQKRSIGDLINFIDWTEAPVLRLLGVNNESKFRLVNWPRTKVEWLEDTMSSRSTTMNDSGGISNSDTTMTVTDGSIFKVGDVLKIENELVYVSAVSGNDLTISRSHGGTSAASHADGLTITLSTIARLEGADYTTGHTTTVTAPYNYTQILAEAVKVTGSESVDEKYGIDDTMAYHIAKLIGGSNGVGTKFKAGKLPILLEQTFFYGYRAAGSATTARAMGGFEQFVTTNVTDKSSAAVTRKDIEDLFETCFLAGGMPDTLLCNSWVRRKISAMYEGSIRTERSETRGGARIDTIVTDFGEIEVMFNRWCPTDRLYLIEKEKMGWITYRPFSIYDRPSTGDYMVKEVLGEYSFVLTNEKAHGYIKNISTSS